MKKLITFLALAFIANLSISQVVFQSDLSSWASGNPADFFGSKTSVSAANVTEVTTGATYGSSYANIINTSATSHKRLTTQALTVVPGTKYTIKIWASTVSGDTTDLRVSLYDLTNVAWTSYTPYQNLTGTATTMYEDSVVAPAGCTSLEFIISFKNSNALGFSLDSVSISGPPAPP
ncbi:carbohydrate binding domain-containing protein, partial [Flavobacteriales bacterium]|nr:carbohydrate binding domain-containing protein [Flavobacteriales bacterium]